MAVLFSPWGNQQFLDSNSVLATGYKIYTYAAGSSTPLATYTDATGATPQANPIELNALGLPTSGQIWLTSGLSYKLVWTTPAGVVLKTEDNITGVTGVATVSQWQASGLTPTYVSTTSFTLAGDQTSAFHVNRRLQFTTTAGTVYGTIDSSAYAALTTVTVVMDSGQVLDSGLSQVNYGLLTATNNSLPLATTAQVQTGTSLLPPSVDSMRNGLIVLGTKQAANVAVAVFDFTGIPAYAKRVFVHYYLYSTNGTSPPLIQIGDAGGFETAGYVGSGFDGSGGAAAAYTTGFGLGTGNNAAAVMSGTITLTRIDSATHAWSASGGVGRSDAGQTFSTLGAKTLTAALDRVRATTVGGVNTADGTADSFINISWE